jgi:NAD-dependent deacetylase
LVFTQNVDGLHRAAGSRRLIEVHGNLHELVCTACDFGETVADLAGRRLPPECPACGALLRPNVVLFGEALPAAAIDDLLEELDAGMDMVFTIGTSGAFPYIAEPVLWAAQASIPTVEINPQPTRLTPFVRYHVQLGAADAMSALMERLAGRGLHA